MKRMVFGLSLALAALGFLGSPASTSAAGPQRQGVQVRSTADQAFLASLASQPPKGRAAAAKPQSGGGEKALCSSTAACGGGVTVSCNSNSSTTSCSSADRSCPERGHVTCNGVTTWCPDPCPCSASVSCGRAGGSVSCSGSSCSSTNRSCAAGQPGSVTCDGNTYTCGACVGCSTLAFCGGGGNVHCDEATNCSGADTNCPYEQGHVTCDGSTQWCPNTCCQIDCWADEMACAQMCGSCPYSFSCNEFNCSESCNCQYWACPLQ